MQNLLEKIKDLDIRIQVEGNDLRLNIPENLNCDSLIEEIRTNKKDLINFIQGRKGDVGNEINQLVSVDQGKKIKLTPAQRRLFILDRMAKDSVVYNTPLGIEIIGALDKDLLENSIIKLIHRHEILRTEFSLDDKNNPVQTVKDEVDFKLERIDATEEGIDTILKNFVRPFDLEKAPLLRAGLIQLTEERAIFILDLHHIIVDGVSQKIFIQELLQLYYQQELQPSNLQFKDYVQWYYSPSNQNKLSSQRSFWLQELSGYNNDFRLPTDSPRKKKISYKGKSVSFNLGVKRSKQLNKIAKESNTSLFIVLMSIYGVFLSKLTQAEDIVIGTPVANRMNLHFQRLMGMIVNTLPIRLQPKASLRYKDYLKLATEKTLACFDNQEYIYEELIKDLDLSQNADSNPLFDVVISLNNIDNVEIENADLKITPFEIDKPTAKFDLSLHFTEKEGALQCVFEYRTELYAQKTIKKYFDFVKNIADQIANDKSIYLKDISLLNKKQTTQILKLNDFTDVDYPEQATIVQLFEKQAAANPENTALIVDENTTISYRALNAKANQIAWRLKSEGVGRDTVVGLFMDKSIELIAGMLGVLKAGGAYMPIDLTYPASRINYLIENSGTQLVLTNRDSVHRLEDSNSLLLLMEDISDEQETNPPQINQPSDLCYIIYTSGTTGNPKGVMVEHRNLVRLFFNNEFQFDFGSDDTWTMFHSASFDFSVWEIYGALLNGGKLVIIPAEVARNPFKFKNIVQKQKVTVLNQTPTAFYNFIRVSDQGEDVAFPDLRYVIFGGEALTPIKLLDWHQANPETQLINMYGITEMTVHVTFKKLNRQDMVSNMSNVGKPIPTNLVYLLDKNKNIVPQGSIGEIYVGGKGVTRGYLNNPELTASRFITNPFDESGRLYKSGDLARVLANGDLEYLGRNDRQVQIKGFRIELGEIEYRLAQNKLVKEAVVVAHKDEKYPWICAYVVAEEGINEEELREYLSNHVPYYMVPNYIVKIDKIPYTSNFKVDYKKLPAPGEVKSSNYIGPSTELQKKVAQIWAEHLSASRVGVKDNFFALGGDSIRALSVVSDINEALKTTLEIVDVYEYPTLEELCNYITEKPTSEWKNLKAQGEMILEEFQNHYKANFSFKDNYEEVFPMNGVEKGMVFHSLEKSNTSNNVHDIVYHEQNIYLFSSELFDLDRFRKSLNLLVQKHSALRKIFDLENLAHIVLKEVEPELNFVDISHLPSKEQETFISERMHEEKLRETELNFSLFWRMKIFKVSATNYYLLFDFHHSLFDGWSLSSFLAELYETEAKLTEDENYIPEPLQTSFRDQMITELAAGLSEQSKNYWKTELQGFERLKFYNTGLPHEYNTHFYDLGTDFRQRLEAVAYENNSNLKHLCILAYLYTMKMFTGMDDLTVGLVTNNRPTTKDGEKLLGCFLNTIPFRANLEEGDTWRTLLSYVDKKLVELKRHDKIPLHEIAGLVGENMNTNSPIFNTSFNYIDFHVIKDFMKKSSTVGEEMGFSFKHYMNNNTMFDVVVTAHNSTFTFVLLHSTTVISNAISAKLFEYFNRTLHKLVDELDANVIQNDILTTGEKEYLLGTELNPVIDNRSNGSIIEQFENQVKRTPSETAIVCGENQLTYSELFDKSKALAAFLQQEKGIKPGDLIGIKLDRSEWSVITLLGVLQTRACYVPIDPAYPDQRIKYIESDSQCKQIIDDKWIESFQKVAGAYGDDFKMETPQVLDDVYMIYTSGSTGNPKGVAIDNDNLDSYLTWAMEYYKGDLEKFSFPLFTSMSFDLTQTSILLTLLSGGQLSIYDGEDLHQTMKEILSNPEVNTLKLTPSHLQLIKEDSQSHVKNFILGGEILLPGHVKTIQALSPNARIFNEYGPTEATIGCTCVEVSNYEEGKAISIGKPISNAQVYILNSQNQLTPQGVVGELCVAGRGVAKGYYNRPELTQQRFINDPYSGNSGQRMYKTGDLARWNEDGSLELLGRKDDQVKVRGYRIELGEITACIDQYEMVAENLVLIKKDSQGNNTLVAYLVSKTEEFDQSQLVSYLQDVLPSYMIPDVFMELEELPLTNNGKIDKEKLLRRKFSSTGVKVAPRNEIESKILETWQEILNVDDIGIHDNFFDLGGHSLLAIMLLNKIQREFSVKISMQDLYDNTTLAELSSFVAFAPFYSTDFITPAPAREYYPLSSVQGRQYFIYQLYPDLVLYNMPVNFKVIGKADVSKFEDSINALFKRYSIFRTRFKLLDNKPVQYILDDYELKLEVIDCEESEVNEHLGNFVRPFNLAEDSLIRIGMLRIADDYQILMTDMHHIIFDERSRDIVLEELLAIFKGEELPKPKLEYKDYLVWQEGDYYQNMVDEHKKFWLDVYAEPIKVLELPSDYARPMEFGDKANTCKFSIGKEITDQIKTVVLEHKMSNFSFMIAAYNIFLRQLSKQEDIAVGITVSGRQHVDLDDIVGIFCNTLGLRNYPKGDLTVTEFLSAVRESTVKSLDNQFCPYEDLVDELKVPRVINRTPLFDVYLAYGQDFDYDLLDYPDLKMELFDTAFSIAKFDLTLGILDAGDELKIFMVGHQDLFTQATIDRFASYLKQVIVEIIANPDKRLEDIDMLTEEERSQLLLPNQQSEVVEKSVVEMFIEQVKDTPNNNAIAFNESTLTYKELDQLSNQLAHYIKAKGIKKGQLVGIMMDRSVEMIASFLAVLKLGAAYVPIDPEYPVQRIEYLLDDAKISSVLSTSNHESKLEGNNAQVITLDTEWDEVLKTSKSALRNKVKSSDLMNVIYTSGSTGNPKGVMVEHRSLVNMSLDQIKRFKITAEDRVLQFAALTFDASVSEILMTLLSGATLVMVEKEKINEGSELISYMEKQAVSVVTLPPAYLKVIDNDNLTFLRCLITAGEAANAEDAKYLSEHLEYHNGYGPTECAVCTSSYQVDPTKTYANQIPIGTPLNNLKVYILDNKNNLCPYGVIGEICVVGVGVARGYLNRPELTKDKFVQNPFNETERMYRTGDYGKWNSEGLLEYEGRRDNQIKIRGFRVELGEVEATLSECDLVKQVSVQLIKKGANNHQLVAFVVPNGEYNSDAIYQYLGSKLPGYMKPSYLVAVNNIPLTAHGKVDRKALIKLGDVKVIIDTLPKGELETKVLGLWKEILELEELGVEDNFFEMGGNSLLAIRIVETIKTQLNCELKVKDMFIYPTIRGLCTAITANTMISEGNPIVKVENTTGEVPLSFYQEYIWIIDKLAGSRQYHLPIVQLFGPQLDLMELQNSLSEIVKRHEPLRTIIKERDEVTYQEFLPKDEWELEYDELEGDIDTSLVQQYISEEINQPFNLSRDYRLRGCLFKVGERGFILVMTMHHIAADAQSLNILVRELSEISSAIRENRTPNLPPITIEYSDYAIWQREKLSPELLERKLTFWENKLKGVQPIQLPLDYPRGKVRSVRGATSLFKFDKELSVQINDFCHAENITPFIFLLSTFKILLHKYSEQEDICIGIPMSDRRPEVEDLIGFFINTAAIRTDMGGNPSFNDLLARVKENLFEVYENRDTPIHEVMQRVVKRMDPSVTPLFQVLFHMQNTSYGFDANDFTEEIERMTGKLPFTREEIDNSSSYSKFDLTLNVSEHAGGFNFDIEYCPDLFKSSSIDRMVNHYQRLLEEVIKDKAQPIGSYDYLSGEEVDLLLHEFNVEETTEQLTTPIIKQFEEKVSSTPSAIAITCGDSQYTYSEVLNQSKKLANYLLKAKNIAPGDFVGIKMGRSEWSVITMLATLYAQAAYVPIDPDYPQERIDYIEADSQCKELIDESWIEAYLEIEKDYDAELEELVYQMSDNVYMIYTSGSTGQPKGVAINNNNLRNYVDWAMGYYKEETAHFSFPFFTSLSFDLTQTSILLTLLSGGKLFVYDDNDLLNTMTEILSNSEINALKLTPSHSQLIEDDLSTHITTFILGGEALLPVHIDRLKTASPEARIFNEYGPTEATIGCTCIEINEYREGEYISIGKPIANTKVYLLDSQNQLVPQGVVGELCVSGEGVAHGYHNRMELSQKKFIADPFSNDAERRMYKTGDLARWNSDGQLELIGRKDDQVKIRGYRVELGEVGAYIDNSELVTQSVMLSKPDRHGNNMLIAYIKTDVEDFDKDKLKEYLNGVLPQYMIPDIFVEIDEFPLTQNGKIDKVDLLERKISSKDSGAVPRNEVEVMLLEYWKDLLGVEDIGIYDNFFELGGHSLLAIKLMLKVGKSYSSTLNIEDLIKHPTIESFGEVISSKLVTKYPISVKFSTGKERPDLFFVPATTGDPMSFFELGQLMEGYNSVYAFQAQGLDGISTVHTSIEEMATANIEEMLSIKPIGPYCIGGYSFGSNIVYEMAIQLRERGLEVERLFIFDSVTPEKMPLEEIKDHDTMLIDFLIGYMDDFDVIPKLTVDDIKDHDEGEKLKIMYQEVLDLGVEMSFLHLKGRCQVVLTNKQISYTSRGNEKLDIPVTLFTCEDWDYSWSEVTTGKIDIIPVAGNHMTLLDPPNVTDIANYLKGFWV